MTSEKEALLRAVAATPDDETPRLVFADWLQENGDEEWARLIRLDCEIARTPKSDRRWWQLLFARGGMWRVVNRTKPSLPAGLRWARGKGPRGFPDILEISSMDAFLEHAEDVFTLSPVRELGLDMVPESDRHSAPGLYPEDWGRVTRSPYLGRIRGLRSSWGTFGPDDIRSLVDSPYCEHINGL